MTLGQYIDSVNTHCNSKVRTVYSKLTCNDRLHDQYMIPTIRSRDRIKRGRNMELLTPKLIETKDQYIIEQKKKFYDVITLFGLLFIAWYNLVGTVLLSEW